MTDIESADRVPPAEPTKEVISFYDCSQLVVSRAERLRIALVKAQSLRLRLVLARSVPNVWVYCWEGETDYQVAVKERTIVGLKREPGGVVSPVPEGCAEVNIDKLLEVLNERCNTLDAKIELLDWQVNALTESQGGRGVVCYLTSGTEVEIVPRESGGTAIGFLSEEIAGCS